MGQLTCRSHNGVMAMGIAYTQASGEKSQVAGTLIGGEQQALAIARALMSQPRLLMMDEPSSGLAPRLVAQTYEVLSKLNREGMTILLVEQKAHLALEIAKRVYALETGRIVMEGTSAELRNNETVKRAYLG